MKKLSKSTLRKCWLRWMCGNLCSMSFQWLESLAFADSMAPAIKELYGGDKEKEAEALTRHCAFYNTEPQLGCIVNGIACGLEEEKANGADLDDEVINGIKLGLMGPIAGIGDAMVPGMYLPLLLSIGIGLADGGNVMGPIFYIVTFLATVLAGTYYLFMKGYQMGTKSVGLIVGEASQRVREAFNLLGAIVVGGVGASYVSIDTDFTDPDRQLGRHRGGKRCDQRHFPQTASPCGDHILLVADVQKENVGPQSDGDSGWSVHRGRGPGTVLTVTLTSKNQKPFSKTLTG